MQLCNYAFVIMQTFNYKGVLGIKSKQLRTSMCYVNICQILFDLLGQEVSGAGRRGVELRGAGRRWGKISGAGGHGAEGSGAGSGSP